MRLTLITTVITAQSIIANWIKSDIVKVYCIRISSELLTYSWEFPKKCFLHKFPQSPHPIPERMVYVMSDKKETNLYDDGNRNPGVAALGVSL